jgi:uroporphyrinogen-III synthase
VVAAGSTAQRFVARPLLLADGMDIDAPRNPLRSKQRRSRPVVALLESRMSLELARLVDKHGGAPICVPAVSEVSSSDAEAVSRVLDELAGQQHEVVIFMTGVAVALLFEVAERLGRRVELVAALRRVTTVCRGPKPSAALRGFGVPPTSSASAPFTVAEVVDALSDLEITGRSVLLFHYGERSATVAETLLARGTELHECWLYRWDMPNDVAALERLVRRILAGEVDALALTCQIQFRHLYRVAERLELERSLVGALNDQVVTAVIGPTCRAVVEAYGVRPRVMPEHPKMGPLVAALMRHLAQRSHEDRTAAREQA